MGRDMFYNSLLDLQTNCLRLVVMATQQDKPIEGPQASRPKAADGHEDEEWHNIELPDPDMEWEQVYKCAADPHAIDYYQDEGLVEQPVEDDWTNVTQIPEELRNGKKGSRVISTYDPAGLRDKAKKRLARQRLVKEALQQTATSGSSKDGAMATGTKTKTGTGTGTSDIIDQRAPASTATTTTTAAGGFDGGSVADGWIRAAFSQYPPPSSFLDARRRDSK
ncbi:hypothetical protein F4805DRAFT_343565 [Annulohypoxylon moriforme]|nr:hypothetical protein F4805DRAFT_343565 [Annulohypoxylon moriforme]